MLRKNLLGIAVASLISLAGVMVMPTAATAAPANEQNQAVAGTLPSSVGSGNCISIPGSTACYEANGDRWWVKDTKADGASAVAQWDNWRGNTYYRTGECINSLGNGRWGYCNKNYTEGSLLRLWASVYDASEGVWLDNSDVKEFTA